MSQERALLTGASSGIGLELAREFARHGHPLVLTARGPEELERRARELQEAYEVPVLTIVQDLEQPNAAEHLYEAVRQRSEPIDILVNNAGLGHLGQFWKLPLETLFSMIRVNVEAVVALTRLFLPDMVVSNAGRLAFTASVAAFEPGPLMATYHATKAFVLSLSQSLAEELRDTHITVTAICPVVTDTDFIPKADMVGTKLIQQGNVMAPQEVAVKGYAALMRGDPLYVVGGLNKLQVLAQRLLPKSAQAKAARRVSEKAPLEKRKRRRGEVEGAAHRKEAA